MRRILLVLTLTALPCLSFANQLFDSCQTDADCVLVQDGCCDCNNGGKNRIINQQFKKEYETNLQAQCAAAACPAMMSTHPSCFADAVCVEHICAAQPQKASSCTNESCLASLAKTTQDPTYCTSIKDGDSADACFSAINNITLCDKLQKINRRRCTDAVHRRMANLNHDRQECPSIYSSTRKNRCFIEVAVLSGDNRVCNEIKDPDLRSKCIKGVESNLEIRRQAGLIK